MLTRNKKIILFVIGLIVLVSAYVVGSMQGQRATLKSFVKQYKNSQIEIGYGRYIEYRDISTAIDKQKYDSAKCAADLGASSLYDDLTACLAEKECSKLIDKEKEYKIAPELFDKKPTGFKYYPVKDGIRSCKD